VYFAGFAHVHISLSIFKLLLSKQQVPNKKGYLLFCQAKVASNKNEDSMPQVAPHITPILSKNLFPKLIILDQQKMLKCLNTVATDL
jgi:hypothetical protein